MSLGDRLQHAWNAFTNRDPTALYVNTGPGYSYRPDRRPLPRSSERSSVAAIVTRMAIDAATIDIEHVRLDDNDRFKEVVDSGLNYCLNTSANIDQTGFAFKVDLYKTLLEIGVVAIVPVETSINPDKTESYRIENMRIGEIVEWFPKHVKVSLYDERIGKRQEIVLPKYQVGIVENPFYSTMNSPNSTFQRLNRKLNLLDYVDEQSSSGKLDLIIQLPYTIKSDSRRQQAELRRQTIETQLVGSKYGIAYTDATEKITQLNRPVENNLLTQVQNLKEDLYSELCITKEILNNTADEKTMNNYYSRTVEPILTAVVDEMNRKFLSKTARSQQYKHKIAFFRDQFSLLSLTDIASVGDSLTRNEIITSNEMRQHIGMKPSTDPNADVLRNKNIAPSEYNQYPGEPNVGGTEPPIETEPPAEVLVSELE